MNGSLPELIDPLEFVERKRQVQGTLPLSRMTRVQEVILNTDGSVNVELVFNREDRTPVISGRIEAHLVLECQCCMEPLTWPVASEIRLGIVSSIDEGNLLPDSMEPLLLESGTLVSLGDLVEDELLLAIPPIPQHSNCVSMTQRAAQESSRSSFAILAQLQSKI